MAIDYLGRPIPGKPYKWKHHDGWRAGCSACKINLDIGIADTINYFAMPDSRQFDACVITFRDGSKSRWLRVRHWILDSTIS